MYLTLRSKEIKNKCCAIVLAMKLQVAIPSGSSIYIETI
jgi:hypothetical protein